MRKHIAILTGGTSSERSVALRSAEHVREALSSFADVEVFDFPRDLDTFLLVRSSFVIVVPIFHGRGGEDGTIQGFLEMLSIPYIFSGIQAHSTGMDKALCKQLMRAHGFYTKDWRVLSSYDSYQWHGPVVVKPLDQGCSLGVSLVQHKDDLAPLLRLAFETQGQVLVEELIAGSEFTVAVAQVEGETVALPVIEIRSKKTFFDYESKYDPNLCDELCPAPIEDALARRLQNVALNAHALIGAKHLSRTDLMVDQQGEIWFLEINTIPGLTKDSLTPKAILAGGETLERLLGGWIEDVLQNKKKA